MRISDWSSDVCSSDLRLDVCGQAVELLADVGLAGEHGEFLSEAIFGDTGALLQQQRKLLRQALAQRLRLGRRAATGGLGEALDFVGVAARHGEQPPPIRERNGFLRGKRCTERVEVGGLLLTKKQN